MLLALFHQLCHNRLFHNLRKYLDLQMHYESHQTKIQAPLEVPLFTHGMSIESREVHKTRHIFLHSPASLM